MKKEQKVKWYHFTELQLKKEILANGLVKYQTVWIHFASGLYVKQAGVVHIIIYTVINKWSVFIHFNL